MAPILVALVLAAAPVDLVPPSPPPAAATGATGAIDPEAATRAYLERLPAAQRAKSAAYSGGAFGLTLVASLWGAGVFRLLLPAGAPRRMRELAERASRFRAAQGALYWAMFLISVAVL